MCIRMKCKGEENMLIQIVEDDRALSDGIVLALGEQGTEFVQCTGVKSAEKVYREQSPDLIILDINLPDGSGYDYLKWVRSRADTPVLMLTANDMEMDEVMGLSLGADDYMTKPFFVRGSGYCSAGSKKRGRSVSSLMVLSLISEASFLKREGRKYPSAKMNRDCSDFFWRMRAGF